jgi:hypothetical protein
VLKRPITYEDFNGDTVTETFYFNLTKTELLNWQASVEGGMGAVLQRIIDTNDAHEIIKNMQDIILRAYGKKSDDGKRFIKSPEIREEFEQSAAYDALFMELSQSDDAAVTFLVGVMPKGFSEEAQKELAKEAATPTPPPVPPS